MPRKIWHSLSLLGWLGSILVAAVPGVGFFCFHCPRAVAADTGDNGTVTIQTNQGPVKGKIVRPKSSVEGPDDIGKRAHTPLEVIVPEKPIEPPGNKH
jgi:hypothetical protein